MSVSNIFDSKHFTVSTCLDDENVVLDAKCDMSGRTINAMLNPTAARILAANLIAVADKVDPQPDPEPEPPTSADQGKGMYVAFVETDLNGSDRLGPAVDCNGGVHRGLVLTDFEDALDAAERLVRGDSHYEEMQVVELSVHRRGIVRQHIERSVA